MKYIKFLLTGVLFGIVLSKAEIVSWYRIYEMFKFQSFHMYEIIGTAIFLGIILNLIIKRRKMHTMEGREIVFTPKAKSIPRYLIGGTIFGLGWAMTGACPGPMFIVIGQGIWTMGIVLISAIFGTFVYGLIRHKLPH